MLVKISDSLAQIRKENGKIYLITDTSGGWRIKDITQPGGVVYKVSHGMCVKLDEVEKYINGSSLF